MNRKIIKQIIKMYEGTGRIAFYSKRNKTISCDGFTRLPIAEAILKMLETIDKSTTLRFDSK